MDGNPDLTDQPVKKKKKKRLEIRNQNLDKEKKKLETVGAKKPVSTQKYVIIVFEMGHLKKFWTLYSLKNEKNPHLE